MIEISKPRKVCPWCNGTGTQATGFEIGVGGPCMFCSGSGVDTFKASEVQPAKREPSE